MKLTAIFHSEDGVSRRKSQYTVHLLVFYRKIWDRIMVREKVGKPDGFGIKA